MKKYIFLVLSVCAFSLNAQTGGIKTIVGYPTTAEITEGCDKIYSITAGKWYNLSINNTWDSTVVSAVPTSQTVTTTGSVTAWGSIVYVDATLANIVLTLPTTVGQGGKTITIRRTDATTNTVILIAFAGQTLDLLSSGTEIYQSKGSLTVTANGIVAYQSANSGIAPVMNEYATDGVLATDIITNTANVAFDIATVVIPSFGDWEIVANVNTKGVGINTSTFWLSDASNVIISNTGIRAEYPTSNIAFPVSINKTLRNISAGTYKLRAMSNVANALTIFANTTTPLNTSGYTKITARKVGGNLPIAGYTTESVEAAISGSVTGTNQVLSLTKTNGSLGVATNIITLLPNKEYQITATMRATGLSATTSINSDIFNLTTNTVLATSSLVAPTWTNNSDMGNNVMQFKITPTVTTQLQIRGNGTQGSVTGNIIVQQVGSNGFTTLPILNGGTGSTTQNFVDLTTAQTIAGVKNFTSNFGINQNIPTSNLTVNGSFSLPFTSTGSANFTVTSLMSTINCNNSIVAITVTLPTPVGITGRIYRVKRDAGSTAAVTISTAGGSIMNPQTGTFAATQTLPLFSATYKAVWAQSDGVNWHVIN
jgi:hypothetical protein